MSVMEWACSSVSKDQQPWFWHFEWYTKVRSQWVRWGNELDDKELSSTTKMPGKYGNRTCLFENDGRAIQLNTADQDRTIQRGKQLDNCEVSLASNKIKLVVL